MNDKEFLKFYNEELFYLKELGKEFARENPQIAQHLGIHSEEIQDPFVERLLEGTAFLSARVQQKLAHEQPEVAMQMLSRIAPLWCTPTPAMAVIALEPDLTYPQWHENLCLKKGSRVLINDISLGEEAANFVTARAINLEPVVITAAAHTAVPPSYLPQAVAGYFQDSLSHIVIKLSTQFTVPLQQLKMNPFMLTITGDAVKSNQILHNIFANSLRILLWARSDSRVYSRILPVSALSLAGVKAEDSCLPAATGELPGSRLLREYLNFPAKFLSLEIEGVGEFLQKIPDSYEFELFFIFNNRNLNLLDTVTKNNFRLFTAPIVNLYRKRCDPVLRDNVKFEHPVVVDRHKPNLYKIHHLTEVTGILPDGQDINFSPLFMDAVYGQQRSRCAYSVRRKLSKYTAETYRHSDLAADDLFITLSAGGSDIDLDQINSLSVEAYVSERNFNPRLLQNPVLSLRQSLPIVKVALLHNPSRPKDLPDASAAWDALQIVAENPLKYTLPQVKNNAAMVKNWLYFFANKTEPAQLNRIESLHDIAFKPCYVRNFGAGPITWARAVEARVNILSKNHSDEGAFLFGMILFQALSAYCQLNQELIMHLAIDEEAVIKLE